MTFDDLWISAIKKDCEEGKWLHAIQSAKIGLNWSKDDLIEAVKVKKWKEELKKTFVPPSTMG